MTLAECEVMLRSASLNQAVLLGVLLLSGCVGDIVELTPGARTDMAQGQPDLTPPSGNQDMGGGAIDQAQAAPNFNPTIQADIDSLGCSAASCHGGTQVPVLKRMPALAADITANYTAFKAEAGQGAQSLILTKNLAGSGVTHTGGSSFANKQDAVYQRWLAWINGGTPE